MVQDSAASNQLMRSLKRPYLRLRYDFLKAPKEKLNNVLPLPQLKIGLGCFLFARRY